MKLGVQSGPCDPGRLESFLSGELSGMEETNFVSHLDHCDRCRDALERQAAELEAWREAEQLLRPSQFDSPPTHEQAGDEQPDWSAMSRAERQPVAIQALLDALHPTDDPAMLGRLGGYEVSGVVGAGGMGVVLKASDRSLDRIVAIKVLAPHLATSGAARRRFAREAKAAAAVLHPNVIAIHSVSNDESLPYLVMPYVRGTSLQKRIDREGPLPLAEILRIGSQIAAGLAAAHAQGLVHRDIKPANILLEEGIERVTITDFGLARAVDDATVTHSGAIAGTPQYMSPEQARGEPVDQRSDLFSLGSVLYAACTGRPPFRAETTYGVMRRITDDQAADIRQINSEIPAWLCAIVGRLMSKQAAERYESAAEVAELLAACLAHVQQPATTPLPAELVTATSGSGWKFKSRRTGVLAMLGAASIAVLGMLAWNATEPPDIAGSWTSDEWGTVTLEAKEPGLYAGSYRTADASRSGSLTLEWSRLERRYNGGWKEDAERNGELSVRLVDGELRGGWTSNVKATASAVRPRLGDLLWVRAKKPSEKLDFNRLQTLIDKEASTVLPKVGDPLTALQVVEQGEKLSHGRGKVIVRLRVSETKPLTVVGPSGEKQESRWVLAAEGAPDFSVQLTSRAEEALKKIGVKDVAAHFNGKLIEVHGPVGAVGMDIFSQNRTKWTYYIDVNSLSELQIVDEGDASRKIASPVLETNDPAGKAADSEAKPAVETPSEKPLPAPVPRNLGSERKLDPSVKPPEESTDKPTASALPAPVPVREAGSGRALRKPILQFRPDTDNIRAIAVSPDGKSIAVADGNPTFPLGERSKRMVEIFDGATGKSRVKIKLATKEEDEVLVLAGLKDLPQFDAGPIAFSPDGKLLAAGTGLGQVKLFDSATGKILMALDDEDGKALERTTPKALKLLPRAMGNVTALAFSPDGGLLAVCGSSFDDVARSWGNVDRLVGRLATGPRRLQIWDLKTDQLKHDLVGHSHVDSVAFSADGSVLVSSGRWGGNSDNGTGVIAWDPATGKQLRRIENDANGGTPLVVFSPAKKQVAIAERHYDKETDTSTTIISVAYPLSGITEWKQKLHGWAGPVAFTPDGKHLIVQHVDHVIRLISVESGQAVVDTTTANEPGFGRWSDVTFAPTVRVIVVGGSDALSRPMVEVWRLDDLAPVAEPTKKERDPLDPESKPTSKQPGR